ncbi:MAG: hypothetical protein OHK0029_23510 [Armatimonadaceae bacterium]
MRFYRNSQRLSVFIFGFSTVICSVFVPASANPTWGNPPPAATTEVSSVAVPPLVQRAGRGDVGAVQEIAAIATPEATLALLNLSASAKPPIALSACRAVNQRLPILARDREQAGNPVEAREYLVQNAWQEAFSLPVRVRAAVLLTSRNRDLVREGVEMLERVGAPDDIPQLSRALDSELRRVPDTYPQPEGLRSELLRAVDQLIERGYSPTKTPRTKFPGECAVYLRWVAAKGWKNITPAWQSKIVALLGHPLPSVRAMALYTLPEEFPALALPLPQRRAAVAQDGTLKAARKLMPKLLRDRSLLVRVYACDAAAKVQDWNLVPVLQKVLETSKSRYERAAATASLLELGGRYPCLLTWADHLDRPGLMEEALLVLSRVQAQGEGVYERSGESVQQGKQLQAKWQAFLKAHRKEIEAGKVWQWDDPEVPSDLFPAHYRRQPPLPEYRLSADRGDDGGC